MTARPHDHEKGVNEMAEENATDEQSDDRLLAELKAALAGARHPQQEKLIADGQDAFAFLAVSDEFAALVFDSLWEDQRETTSRALDTIRTLTFEAAGLSLEVELTDDGIVGQLSPAGAARVVAEWADGATMTGETDEFGSFTLAFTPGATRSGPLRFQVDRGDGGTVTDWVSSAR